MTRSNRWLPIAAVFLVLTLIASGGMLALQPLIRLDSGVLALVQFGPAIGAGLTWLILRRRLAELMPARVSRRQMIAHLILALAACAFYAAVLAIVTVTQGLPIAGAHAAAGVPFVVILLAQLLGAIGEEIGWRGLLQPLLERRFSRLLACVVVGVIWGAWHVQIFSAGAPVALSFIATTVVLSILLGYLGNGSPWQRVAAAGLVHWLVNIVLLAVQGERTGQFEANLANLAAVTVTTAVFLAMFVAAQRKRARTARLEGRPVDA